MDGLTVLNKESQPLVSIVTPSFNQGRFLEETILSVLKQDYQNIEYIIVDGGSTDNSVDVIKKYENRLAWWISEPDKGQTDALTKGFQRARGKYLGWLCSDDILEPSMVSLSVHFLEKNPAAVLTYGNRTRIDAKGNIIGSSKPYFPRYLFKYGLGLPQETVLFRNDAYKEVGGLNTDLNMVMDYDLWCRLRLKGTFIYIPAFLGRFRSHTDNKSTLFTHEISNKGYGGKLTAEFSFIYKYYFKRRFSSIIKRIALWLSYFHRLLYFRSKQYKVMKIKINNIQNQ